MLRKNSRFLATNNLQVIAIQVLSLVSFLSLAQAQSEGLSAHASKGEFIQPISVQPSDIIQLNPVFDFERNSKCKSL